MSGKGTQGAESKDTSGGFFDFSSPLPDDGGELFDMTLEEDEAALFDDEYAALEGGQEDGSFVVDGGLEYDNDDEGYGGFEDFDESLPSMLPSQVRFESMVKASSAPSAPSSVATFTSPAKDPWAALRGIATASTSTSSPYSATSSTWKTSDDQIIVRKGKRPEVGLSSSPATAASPLAPSVQQLFAQGQAAAHHPAQMNPMIQTLFQQAQGHAPHPMAHQHPHLGPAPGMPPPAGWDPQAAQAHAYAQHQAALRAQQQAQAQAYLRHHQSQGQHASETGPSQLPPARDERRRPRWRKSKTYLTADDMEQLVRLSEYQLQCDNPYLEDYYYQNYMKKRAPERASKTLLLRHRPIHEVLRPAGTIKKRQGENPFQGALGRIPGHSVRAPRPLVELQRLNEDDDKERDAVRALLEGEEEIETKGEKTAQEKEDDEETARAMVAVTEGLSSLHRTLALAIENALAHVLEIEDLDAILASLSADVSINDGRFNVPQLLEKRSELSQRLFEALHIQPHPHTPPNFAIHKEALALNEDDLFIKFMTVGKGSRLLRRSLLLLPPQPQMAFILALLRNLHVIVSLPNSEGEDQYLKGLFQTVTTVLLSLPFPQFLLATQTLAAYHCTAPYFRRRLTNTAKSKIGSLLFAAVFRRGYEHALGLIQQLQTGVAPQLQGQVRGAIEAWKSLIVTLYEQLAGNLTSLFTSSVSKDYTNVAPATQIWDLVFSLALNASPSQKKDLKDELALLLDEADPAGGEGDVDEANPVRQKVRLLQRVLAQ